MIKLVERKDLSPLKLGLSALLGRVEKLEARSAASLFVPVQLFGPVQAQAACAGAQGPQWSFPGSALSASTKTFDFGLGYSLAKYVRWLSIWSPGHASLRLINFDDGPANIVEMASVDGVGNSPIPSGMDVTAEFNKLVAARKQKHIGFQVRDDGVNPWTLYEVRLEINW